MESGGLHINIMINKNLSKLIYRTINRTLGGTIGRAAPKWVRLKLLNKIVVINKALKGQESLSYSTFGKFQIEFKGLDSNFLNSNYLSWHKRYLFWQFFFSGFFFDEIFSLSISFLFQRNLNLLGYYFFDRFISSWMGSSFFKSWLKDLNSLIYSNRLDYFFFYLPILIVLPCFIFYFILI